MSSPTTVIGAGLAGCEAAWQLARRGLDVVLIDMKPGRRSAAHATREPAELVCSNSLRSMSELRPVGLLKQEMRQLGSLLIEAAYEARVPAGDALAVDRDRFSAYVATALAAHPHIRRVEAEIDALPAATTTTGDVDVIVATGPLTADALANAITATTGQQRLHFYDAIAPIVAADGIDHSIVFAASRYGKGDGDDYLNCPMHRTQYEAFVAALLQAECTPLHDFEKAKYFQGCLPVEVIARSGPESLRFGPMKPVGLDDPRTGRRPYAVVQLRCEDIHRQSFNLVGFQTKLKQADQRRIIGMIPGLKQATVLRYGAVHRNTYLDAPALLDAQMRLRGHEHLRFAGQITGVEGYVESAAHGLLVGLMLAAEKREGGAPLTAPLTAPPQETALGALWRHVTGETRLHGRGYEPSNIHWGMFPPPPAGTRKKDTTPMRAARAQSAFAAWLLHVPPVAEYNRRCHDDRCACR